MSGGATEIAERADFSEIRYAQCWEDADVLCRGLRVHEGRDCLSIGSAGDNSFALLAAGASSVLVAEMNAAQVACIALRRAAYLTLNYPQFLQLLGVRPCARRHDLYLQCRGQLGESASEYWDARSALIQGGIIHGGKFERYFRLFRKWILPIAHRRRRVEGLFHRRHFEERKEYYDTVWNNRRWRLIFHVFFSRTLMGRLGRDPEFFKYVEGSVASRILGRARHALVELDPVENPYLHFILFGEYGHALPMGFREEHFEPIRSALREEGRFAVHEGSIETLLNLANGRRFSAFNLSDIFEYMSEANTERLMRTLLKHSHPGARLLYWNMLVPRRGSELLPDELCWEETEASELHREDKAFFYSKLVLETVV